ncbi:MAG: Dps family protein [Holosporales bacterium]
MADFIGLNDASRRLVASHLEQVLASTYVLAAKTQHCHWNGVGPRFHMLHEFFGEQYEALFEAIDDIAERIRQLGFRSPGSLAEFLALSKISELKPNDVLNEDDMLRALLADHETVIALLRDALTKIEDSNDEGSIDFLIGRLQDHEKMAWMLRSHLPTH